MSGNETTLKILQFKAEGKDYVAWRIKYLARAQQRKKHQAILLGKEKIPEETEDEEILKKRDEDMKKFEKKKKLSKVTLICNVRIF